MGNDNIVIIEKPENISCESLQQLLHTAHQSNAAKGLIYGTANQSVAEWEKILHKNAICFVALDGDKLAGTATLELRKKSLFFINFEIACFGLFGVLPEYKRKHLGDRLLDKCIETYIAKGYKYLYCSTATDNNLFVRNMYEKRGFKKVDFFKAKANNFYSVRYLKWNSESVLLDIIAAFTYNFRRFYVRHMC